MKKTVTVLGYEFDSLPAHVKLTGRGSGANLRVACQRAIADLFTQRQLRHKQTGSFKISVVVVAETRTIGGQEYPAAKPPNESSGNCGACLLEHVAIVPLRADGTCECCENEHNPAVCKRVALKGGAA